MAALGRRILFAWRRQTPPAFVGGAELTEAEMAVSMAAAGHDVTFVGSFENPRDPRQSGRAWLESMLRDTGIDYRSSGSRLEYTYRGVRCTATSQRDLEAVIESAGGDAELLVTSQEGCPEIAALRRDLPAVSFVHSVSQVGLLSVKIPNAILLAPSLFVQRRLSEVGGFDSTLVRVPFGFEPRERPVEPDQSVLFVNPVPEKGLEVAAALAAALPDVRFTFVESWRAYDGPALPPNVEVLGRRRDLTSLLSRASIMIVPSVVEDAAPRVIAEAAQYGGVSVGARRGGIPELIGNDTLVLPPDAVGDWTDAVAGLLSSPGDREDASKRQVEHCAELFRDEPARVLLDRIGL